MIENTVKTGLEIGVGAKGESRYSARRIVIVIALIASVIGAVAYAYNGIRGKEDTRALIEREAFAVVQGDCRRASIECRDFQLRTVHSKKLSRADEANGITGKMYVEVEYLCKLSPSLPWTSALSRIYFTATEDDVSASSM